MHGDNAHALVYSPESGESPFFFLSFTMYISLALYCVVPEGFHTSLNPEEALIYTSMTVVWSGCLILDLYRLWEVYGASSCYAKTTLI